MKVRNKIDHVYTLKIAQEMINALKKGFIQISKLTRDEMTENKIVEILSKEYDNSLMRNSDNMYNMSKAQYEAAARKMSTSIRQNISEQYKYNFKNTDREMLNTLDRTNSLFIGKFFSNMQEPLIRSEMQKMATSGLQSKTETVQAIADMLKEKAGRQAYNYSKMIVETNGTWARSISNTNLLEDVGITEYGYLVIEDNVTSEICLSMVGKTGTIQDATTLRDQYLNLDKTNYETAIDELKQISPFITATENGFKAGNRYFDKSQIENIPGIALPPFHANCRTEIIIIT